MSLRVSRCPPDRNGEEGTPDQGIIGTKARKDGRAERSQGAARNSVRHELKVGQRVRQWVEIRPERQFGVTQSMTL